MPSSKKIKIKESPSAASSPEETPNKEEKKLFQADGQLAVDVFETNSDFVVMAAIAGILSKDVEIQIDKDMLVIKGCRNNPENDNNRKYFYQECYWGSFSRKIILPDDVDVSAAQADFNKGILAIKFPKNSIKSKKDIEVKES
jgi:HSP20 family protein